MNEVFLLAFGDRLLICCILVQGVVGTVTDHVSPRVAGNPYTTWEVFIDQRQQPKGLTDPSKFCEPLEGFFSDPSRGSTPYGSGGSPLCPSGLAQSWSFTVYSSSLRRTLLGVSTPSLSLRLPVSDRYGTP